MPSLSRKVYEDLATTMAKVRPPQRGSVNGSQWQRDLAALCAALKRDNPRFDAARFVQECEARPTDDGLNGTLRPLNLGAVR